MSEISRRSVGNSIGREHSPISKARSRRVLDHTSSHDAASCPSGASKSTGACGSLHAPSPPSPSLPRAERFGRRFRRRFDRFVNVWYYDSPGWQVVAQRQWHDRMRARTRRSRNKTHAAERQRLERAAWGMGSGTTSTPDAVPPTALRRAHPPGAGHRSRAHGASARPELLMPAASVSARSASSAQAASSAGRSRTLYETGEYAVTAASGPVHEAAWTRQSPRRL